MQQKSIYIILTRTTTVISRLISLISGKRYTHASISLDKNLSAIYSFGRKQRHNPLIGGFCRENLDAGIFADCKSLPYAIVEVNVKPEQYDKVDSLLQSYIQNIDGYHYNYAGLLFACIGKVYKCSGRFYCSEFVYDLLRQCEIICEDMSTIIHPQELMKYGKIIYEGDWKRKLKETRTGLRRNCVVN